MLEKVRAADTLKLFTVLHTNDMHSNLMGRGPSSEYTPLTLGDDSTIGGFARLSTLIRQRRDARLDLGPVLVLDAGDYSMGTMFGAATRETGCELQLMALMGYDVTTLGNHDFDFGLEGLAKSIGVAAEAGRIPTIVASNTRFSSACKGMADLERIVRSGLLRRYLVIERGGISFGIFGLLGTEAGSYTLNLEGIFSHPIDTAREMVKHLRDREKVDIIICLSHGGVVASHNRTFAGEDIQLATAVPGIDLVIGGHSHTRLVQPIMVNGRTPVVQAGKNAENLGELMIALGVDGPKSMSYRLHAVNDTIQGDHALIAEIDRLKKIASRVVCASRGYAIDQPLAVAPCDLPNSFRSLRAGALLGNLVTDAIRRATNSDVGFTLTGMLRSGFMRGRSGVQTAYDVFALAPLGAGIIDSTPGNALVIAYFTAKELKNILEFFLTNSATRPNEYFPLTSGLRFQYNRRRPKFDAVTRIELGDAQRGYRLLDISGSDARLYSVSCPLSVGLILAGIPSSSEGKLNLIPKNRNGQPFHSRAGALVIARNRASPYPPPPKGDVDNTCIATVESGSGIQEIKEWQAIMDYLCSLPKRGKDKLPIIPVGERAAEIRALEENYCNPDH